MPDALPASGEGEQTSRGGARAVATSGGRAGSPGGSLIGALASAAAIRVIPTDENAMIVQYGTETIVAGTT